MRYFLILLLLMFVTFSFPSMVIAQEQTREIKVFIDGLPVLFDVQPVMKSGRTMVPFRGIAEALNITVTWDGPTETIKASDGKNLVEVMIGNENAFRNGSPLSLDVPPVIIDRRTFIPLRFFGEAFNCDVTWNPDTWIIEIASAPKDMTVIGFYALGDTQTSSWTNLFRRTYPETHVGNTDVVDKLALGWYSFDEQGYLLTRSSSGWQRPSGWDNVLVAANIYKLKTEMTIYGNDRQGALSAVLASETASARLIKAIMDEAVLYGGVNLNFEEFGLAKTVEGLIADRELFNNFVRSLSAQLKTVNKSLTLTIHPPNSSYRGYDYKVLGELADLIIIMAYDYGTKPEPLELVVQAVEMAIEDVVPQKIVLGVCAPYETVESIVGKIGVAKRYNLHGISIWRLGLVTPEIWQVLRSNVL